jgi:hypothetical protein
MQPPVNRPDLAAFLIVGDVDDGLHNAPVDAIRDGVGGIVYRPQLAGLLLEGDGYCL